MRIRPTRFCLILLLVTGVFSTVASAKIVFDSTRDGVKGIYVMDDDGSNVTLLTDTLWPITPRWSPDGKQIVFKRRILMQDSQRSHLFIMNADGTNLRQLTEPHTGMDTHPSFSPDGKSILFTRYKDKKDSINVLDLESGVIKKIADLGANNPDWSPDGKQIVCSAIPVVGGDGGGIWIINADGRNARELFPPLPKRELIISRWDPRWAPDGKRILYTETHETLAKIGNVTHYIPQAAHYLIYDVKGQKLRKLKIPKNWYSAGIAWMDKRNSVLFSAVEIKLNQQFPR